MPNTPKVSVVIPIHNVEKFIDRCLTSILEQTLSDIEIICVDDASSDLTPEIIAKYAAADSRIVSIRNEKSLYAAGTRNKGLEIARGEYIGFVDSDDFIDANFYEVLYNAAKTADADIARATYKYYYGDDTEEVEDRFNKTIRKRLEENKELGMNDHSVVIWNAIYRRTILVDNNIKFDTALAAAEDMLFTAMTTFFARISIPVEGTFYHYRTGAGLDGQITISMEANRKIYPIIKANLATAKFLNRADFTKSPRSKDDYAKAYNRVSWRLGWILAKKYKTASIKELLAILVALFYIYIKRRRFFKK
ncbi:MAG: glycosyltransferase [Alphaproteobacteria bacterium]|nr:glycosyltransferase [Alphaproteobacteria bacterium]